MGIPTLVIAGTNSGCGKTTVSMGIMAALVEKGLKVQPYKVGPDYIDPMFHTFITGRESRNLDSWILSPDTVRYLFDKNSVGVDVAVVEGVMGFYDGIGGKSLEGSTVDVASIIEAPVILVINGEAMSLSAAALVKGFAEFDKNANVKGVIINNISGEGHYKLLKESIEHHTGIKVLGYLAHSEDLCIGSRHLGLVTSSEISGLKDKVRILSRKVQETIDLELLIKLANEGGRSFTNQIMQEVQKCPLPKVKECPQGKVRIGVACDKAFCFYYRDSLELLEMMGAELVYFSPLEDTEIPEGIDGIYLGGGYPEVWAEDLQANKAMRSEIKYVIDKGLPVYAECGGFMYLTDRIVDFEGREFGMVGAIKGNSIMTTSLQRFGYVHVKTIEDNILAKTGAEIRAHEFHFSETIVDEDTSVCFKISKNKDGLDGRSWECAFKKRNILACYPHLHFWANPDFAKGFINSCAACRESGGFYEG